MSIHGVSPSFAAAGALPAGPRKVRFAIVDDQLVAQLIAPLVDGDSVDHQEPLRIVRHRNWVQIGCTRMDWKTYDRLVKEIAAE